MTSQSLASNGPSRHSEVITPVRSTPQGEPTAEVMLLLDRAAGYARQARAENTIRAYRSDWSHFGHWCERHGLMAMPAEPTTVAAYLADVADRYRPSTISRRLSSISIAHQQLGHPSPTSDPAVRTVARGVRRTLSTAVRSARPVSIGDLRMMVAHTPTDVLGLRDRAMLLVGFAGALRRSEIVATDVGDLEARPEGLLLHLRRSKTDPEGAGRDVALPRGHDAHTCPVTAIERWRTAAEITDGPLFRRIDRHRNIHPERLTPQAVNIVIKRAAERADIDPSRLTGHSLRAGFATTAAANGATEAAIARQTGHTSMDVLRTYIRHGTVFTDNAVNTLGL